jgi:hypothetical protein
MGLAIRNYHHLVGQCLINAQIGQVESGQDDLHGNASYQK